MATLQICGDLPCRTGKPHDHLSMRVHLLQRPIVPGTTVVNWIQFEIGADTIEVWPADPSEMRRLAEDLARLAGEIEGG